MHLILSILLAFIVSYTSTKAASPVAIIEEIISDQNQYGPMDFLFEGTEINLNSNDILILGYFTSCLQEKITGGKVRVGLDKSYVDNGKIIRKIISCEGGTLNLTEEQSGKSGVLVFRKTSKRTRLIKSNTIYPVFYIPLAVKETFPILRIKNLRNKREIHKIKVTQPVVDLKRFGIVLQNDTKYLAYLGKESVTFLTPKHNNQNQESSILSRILILKK